MSFPIVVVSEQKEHSDLFVCWEAMAIARGFGNISSAGQRKPVNPPMVLHHCASLLVGVLCT